VRSEFLNQLQKGAIRKGVVSSIVNFGRLRRSRRRRRRSGARLGAVLESTSTIRPRWFRWATRSTVEVLDVDMDRERVSVVAQGDSGRSVAALSRVPHAIGPDRAGQGHQAGAVRARFVRVEEGIEGPGAHLRAVGAPRRGAPTQVVQVGDDAMVKVIDIGPGASPHLAEASSRPTRTTTEEFDPLESTGMADSYDEQGNYIFPEGFDSETNEWLEGFDKQREEWEVPLRPRPSVVTRCPHHRRWRSSPAAEAEEAAKAFVVERRVTLGGAGGQWLARQRTRSLAALREKLAGSA